MNAERLQKLIAQAGICSRRKAEELILAGRVRVNGKVVNELGRKADPERDRVEVDGKTLQFQKKIYLLLYKPDKTVTTTKDEAGRATVFDLLRDKRRLFPVGRLDYHTEGVLLLTNDGELTHRLTHPSNAIIREYEVKVSGRLSDEQIARIEQGVMLEDGPAQPVSVEPLRRTERNSWYLFTLTEGRNHEVLRIVEAVGGRMMKLKRISFAGLRVDDMAPGEVRALNPAEILKLYALTGMIDESFTSESFFPAPSPRNNEKILKPSTDRGKNIRRKR